MEISNSFLSVRELVSSNPGGGIISTLVALPSNQISNFTLEAIVDSGIKDFRNLIFFLVFDLNWGRRLDFTVRDGAREMGFELGDMEYGVDAAHVRR